MQEKRKFEKTKNSSSRTERCLPVILKFYSSHVICDKYVYRCQMSNMGRLNTKFKTGKFSSTLLKPWKGTWNGSNKQFVSKMEKWKKHERCFPVLNFCGTQCEVILCNENRSNQSTIGKIRSSILLSMFYLLLLDMLSRPYCPKIKFYHSPPRIFFCLYTQSLKMAFFAFT